MLQITLPNLIFNVLQSMQSNIKIRDLTKNAAFFKLCKKGECAVNIICFFFKNDFFSIHQVLFSDFCSGDKMSRNHFRKRS